MRDNFYLVHTSLISITNSDINCLDLLLSITSVRLNKGITLVLTCNHRPSTFQTRLEMSGISWILALYQISSPWQPQRFIFKNQKTSTNQYVTLNSWLKKKLDREICQIRKGKIEKRTRQWHAFNPSTIYNAIFLLFGLVLPNGRLNCFDVAQTRL